jgi:hypothetical protein
MAKQALDLYIFIHAGHVGSLLYDPVTALQV